MNGHDARLWAVAYHYVRDLPRTRFPGIKGKLTSQFEEQVDWLSERCEMATLQSATDFLAGNYHPTRDLCLLTFDDGLKDHYTNVTPILAERNIQGLFFITTVCLEEHRVLPIHKNHFLMAGMVFNQYRDAFLTRLAAMSDARPDPADAERAKAGYPWDAQDVAEFKFFLNYRVPEPLRVQVLDALFATFLGDETAFAKELYLSWDEAKEMQARGMMMGGHTHQHIALSKLGDAEQAADLAACAGALHQRLTPQSLWPFTYPYGHNYSFNAVTVRNLQDNNFTCSFTTEPGANEAGADPFTLHRIDTNDVLKYMQPAQAAAVAGEGK
jgi:peptidoglycan/xylan/chitin deacetylase (PgdA/CDA1 family)